MNEKKPGISVLMPAYNCEPYVGAAIESVLAQTWGDFELLIADDRSTDGTWRVLQDYARKDGRIKLFRNERNMGVSKTRNFLIQNASGEYIAWQDSDDISYPHRLEVQRMRLERDPQTAIVGGYLHFMDGNGRPLHVRTYPAADAELRRHIFKYSPVSQPVAMIRRSTLKKAGSFDERLRQAEDLDLSFRLGRHGTFANIEEPLLYYRFHQQSLSAGKLKENIRDTLAVRRRAATEYGYRMGAADRIAYAATWAAQYLPSGLIQWSFGAFRGLFIKSNS